MAAAAGRAFQNPPLRSMVAVGAVARHEARIWLRSDAAGHHRVRWWPDAAPERAGERAFVVPEDDARDHTHSLLLPGDDGGAAPLEADAVYRFRVEREGGGPLGEGRFQTAPASPAAAPDRFAFALASCHQPFDAGGAVDPDAEAMLRAMLRCLRDRGGRFALTVGDQLYTDYPKSLSLFDADYFATVAPAGRRRLLDCSAEEVRRVLHDRYRHWWNVPGWRALHAEIPVYPILDDHEIVDNWGSAAEHQREPWRSVGRGARLAYLDYQASRVQEPGVLPDAFDYTIQYGPVAVRVLDLRSQRTAVEDGRLYGESQWKALQQFLRDEAHRQILFLVLSVPPVHVPRWAAQLASRVTPAGEDFSDRWSSGAHVRDRDRLLALLHHHQRLHPEQRLVILSGDIHIGCVHTLRWHDGVAPLVQLVSSGLTHAASRPVAFASGLSLRANREIATQDGRLRARVRRLRGERGVRTNPYLRRNFALVELERPAGEERFRMRLGLWGHRGDEPVCVYRSPEL